MKGVGAGPRQGKDENEAAAAAAVQAGFGEHGGTLVLVEAHAR